MYYQMEADETLVMLTLAGDEGAYEALVKRYQRAVISSAISITKNHFMAEDAAQDAFVTAWMKLDTLYEAQKFGVWVCKIAKNYAVNMITRYRSFLPLDVVEHTDIPHEHWLDPVEEYALSEERKEVDQSVERLPDRVREIVRLHYFEGLSIAEIADRMRISAGTVKWQLNDGRRRIRKELCAMNERYGDTLTERVMKKVEEIKLWQLKNDKSGFEAVYKEVLREVEELPESSVRSHALADVLMRGWWWIPGKKNDALFARIADAATKGKNEDVMTFIVAREDSVLHGDARIEFIRDKQIPRLEKLGFVKTLGREWFWLGYNCFREGRMDEAHAAYLQVEKVLSEGDAYFALVPYTKMMEEQLSARYKDTVKERYRIGAIAEELRMVSGALRYWNENGFGEGYLGSMDRQSGRIFRNASCCDGQFFAEIAPGEVYEGTDGTRLLYISDNESADTPLGRFEGCKVWETRCWTDIQKIACRTYYKEGIGIVRQEHTADGVTEVRTLSAYEIKGGSGLLPLYTGNTWEYSSGESPEAPSLENTITVSFADADRVLLTHWENVERRDYDESSWVDMVQEIANEYMITDNNGNARVCDVSHAIERACLLAVTPMQKVHSEAAASVARRIMETDPVFNPDYKTTGHWNFFGRNYIRRKGETLCLTGYNSGWSFEYKCYGGEVAEEPILYNDILGILQDAANCLWSEEWRIGESSTVEYTFVSNDIKTLITCMDGGTVTTQAGCFRNCLKLCLDIKGMESGWSYRGGKKAYYFAEGIGIVRTENTYCGGAMTAVYQLTSYEGTGEGYMPIGDGFKRRYDALDLTDGFRASVEYAYVADDDGDIVVFSDQTGVRDIPPPITQYSSIYGEELEDRLWSEGKKAESRLRHEINSFHLLCHFLGRPTRYWGAPEKAVACNKQRLRVIESLGEDGTVPQAWLGYYASTVFRTACALFGCGEKEEGYKWLERAFEVAPKWDEIPVGAELSVGDQLTFGGIKVIKGKKATKLPDGTLEPIFYKNLFEGKSVNLIHYGMTAARGWEWFNGVRGDERFKEYIERIKRMKG